MKGEPGCAEEVAVGGEDDEAVGGCFGRGEEFGGHFDGKGARAIGVPLLLSGVLEGG